MSKNDVSKDFQHLYESSNNGEYWGNYFDGATYNRAKNSNMKTLGWGNKKKDNMNTLTGMTATSICVDDIWNYKATLNRPNSFAPPSSQVCNSVPCQNKTKGNNPMYVENDKHIESAKINYLNDRARSAYYSKTESLPSLFGFQTSKMPTTTQGLIDAFVNGKFKVKDVTKKDTEGYFGRPTENILFVDPAVVEDPVGLKAANAALQVVYQDAKDTIAIGTLAEGLAAVKALDAWTPTKTV